MWWEYAAVAAGIVVFLVAVSFALLMPRRRSRTPRVSTPPPPASITMPGDSIDVPAPPVEGVATAEAPPVEAPLEERPIEVPAPAAGRLGRLRGRLARSQSTLGRGLLSVLSRDRLDDDAWTDVEDLLLSADVGLGPARDLVDGLRTRVRAAGARTPEELRELLREELLAAVHTDASRDLATERHGDRPAVVLVVGVNGTGKTTTCGKIARLLVADGRRVLLGAADTFRAAAVDQLETWGGRVGARTVRGPEGGDPAAVAFDAVRQGIEGDADGAIDTVLIDTAGRLHNKAGLMDELGKVKRVVEKQGAIDEVLLVLDATTGQNGLTQARVFAEVVDITGIALTKLDGTAKGGIVIAVQRDLGVPVKLVGLGEGPDDLAPFEPEAFVDALIGLDGEERRGGL